MLIGLTGRYCAGKNHIGRLLEARGWEVLDVDKLGHQAIEAEKDAIVARFGTSILNQDGTVNRAALGGLVYGNPAQLAALEGIVHPAANRLSEEWIAARPGRRLAINAALLHRSTLFDRLDLILLVRAPFLVRLLRALRRDTLGLAALLERFKAQKAFEAQYFSRNADIQIVHNLGAFPLGRRCSERRLAERLDSILAREGMDR